jgi:hypothetical protein
LCTSRVKELHRLVYNFVNVSSRCMNTREIGLPRFRRLEDCNYITIWKLKSSLCSLQEHNHLPDSSVASKEDIF